MATAFSAPRLHIVRPVSAAEIVAHSRNVERFERALRSAKAAQAADLARYSVQLGYRVTLDPAQGYAIAARECGL